MMSSTSVRIFGIAIILTLCLNLKPTSQVSSTASADDKRLRPAVNKLRSVAVDFRAPNASEDRIKAAFTEETNLEFTDTPLIDCIDFLAELHNIRIHLDENALAEEGIATDEPVNMVVGGVTFRSGLRLVLRPLGLTYFIQDEVLKITTPSAASEQSETRVYNLLQLRAAGYDSKTVADVIQETVAPTTWSNQLQKRDVAKNEHDRVVQLPDKQTGKPITARQKNGSLHALPTCLVVRQSPVVHRQIVNLLDQLQRAAVVAAATPDPAEARILAALSEPTEIEFTDTRLIDCIEFLSDLHNIPILLDETALGEEGVAIDQPITLVLSGVTLRSTLQLVLRPLGLTYIYRDEVLTITAQPAKKASIKGLVLPTSGSVN